jgi:hypothetical protein
MDDQPFVEGVIRHRRWLRIALRICAVVLVFLGARWAVSWTSWAIDSDMQGYSVSHGWASYGVMIGFYWLTALLLVLCEPTLVRWVVPYSAGGCLGCGYPADGADRCPECGLPIPKDAEVSRDGRPQ